MSEHEWRIAKTGPHCSVCGNAFSLEQTYFSALFRDVAGAGENAKTQDTAELTRKATGHTLYILDEPTTGLHFHDVAKSSISGSGSRGLNTQPYDSNPSSKNFALWYSMGAGAGTSRPEMQRIRLQRCELFLKRTSYRIGREIYA